MSEIRGEADIFDDVIDNERIQLRDRCTSRTLPVVIDEDENEEASPGVPLSRRISVEPEYRPSMLSATDDAGVDNNTQCGFLGRWTPAFLQPLANTKVFALLYVFQDIFRSMFFAYWTSSISTVEKRYRFPSKLVGSFSAMGEGGKLVCVLLFAHFGGRGHRPRWMAIGCMCVALASITLIIPETFVPLPSQTELVSFRNTSKSGGKRRATEEMCRIESDSWFDGTKKNNQSQCGSTQQAAADSRQSSLNTKVWWAIGLFVLGHTIIDAGSTIPRTIGVPFIYDNVKLSSTPIYYACLYAGHIIGPLSGYTLGSLTSRVFVDPRNPPEGVGLNDPQWIGAWYLGYIAIFFGALIAAFLFLWFPRQVQRSPRNENQSALVLRNIEKNPAGKRVNTINRKSTLRYGEKGRQAVATTQKARLRDLPHDVLHLLKNPFVLFVIFGRAIDVLGSAGFRPLTPKYMENHFRVTASKANVFTGVSSTLAFATSGLIGAFVIKRFNLQPRHLGVVMLVTQVIVAFGTMGLTVFSCDGPRMAGQIAPNKPFETNSACSSLCQCADSAFTPVCDKASGINYFSPCRAGCTQRFISPFDNKAGTVNQTTFPSNTYKSNALTESYTNCSCLGDLNVVLTRGYCKGELQGEDASPCDDAFYKYNLAKMAIAFVAGLPSVGGIMILFRVVEPELKSLATGLFSFTATLMGFLPGSYIAGSILDSTCILWNKSGGTDAAGCAAAAQSGLSNCFLYDNATLRFRFHFFMGILRTVGLIFDAASVWWVWNLKFNLNDEDDKEDADIDKRRNKPVHVTSRVKSVAMRGA